MLKTTSYTPLTGQIHSFPVCISGNTAFQLLRPKNLSVAWTLLPSSLPCLNPQQVLLADLEQVARIQPPPPPPALATWPSYRYHCLNDFNSPLTGPQLPPCLTLVYFQLCTQSNSAKGRTCHFPAQNLPMDFLFQSPRQSFRREALHSWTYPHWLDCILYLPPAHPPFPKCSYLHSHGSLSLRLYGHSKSTLSSST